ncbi:putative acetylxylan esterase [Exidia glandulosa HHB12029]|uniref:Carboxylic ester hydrolase n=1 Tax=Exidia glandulosa HHB12029 TaxID=1314781 RepID=A0A165HA21_EXIGL|nr:putative acetylxylan esterase [Exidia glandulosa HHB12029]
MLCKFFRSALVALLGLSSALAVQNQLVQVTDDIGPNPNNVGIFLYRPTNVVANPPLIVAIHFCTGSAQIYFQNTQYAAWADKLGFLVIYPDAPRDGKCFDVHSPETLTHNGGGDSQGIASAVQFAIANWGVDPARVFVTGSSSGAMMTNVMSGSYPELFAAASVYSGVPFACFAGPGEWNTPCAEGQVSHTAEEWGDIVRAAYPGYLGSRPRMLIWHGTADDTLAYPNYAQTLLEWTNVLNVPQAPTTTTVGDPDAAYTKTVYGDATNPEVIGYSGEGVGHTVPVHETFDLAFFGIDMGDIPDGPTVDRWGQCGGEGSVPLFAAI